MFYIWLREGINTPLFFVLAILLALAFSIFAFFVYPRLFLVNKPGKSEERLARKSDGTFELSDEAKRCFSEIRLEGNEVFLKKASGVNESSFTIAFMSGDKCLSSVSAKDGFKIATSKISCNCDPAAIDSICIACVASGSNGRYHFVEKTLQKSILLGVIISLAFAIPTLMFALLFSDFFVWDYGHIPEYSFAYFMPLIGLVFGALAAAGTYLIRKA